MADELFTFSRIAAVRCETVPSFASSNEARSSSTRFQCDVTYTPLFSGDVRGRSELNVMVGLRNARMFSVLFLKTNKP